MEIGPLSATHPGGKSLVLSRQVMVRGRVLYAIKSLGWLMAAVCYSSS